MVWRRKYMNKCRDFPYSEILWRPVNIEALTRLSVM